MSSVAALEKLTRGRTADDQSGAGETLVTDDSQFGQPTDDADVPRPRTGRIVNIAQRDSAA